MEAAIRWSPHSTPEERRFLIADVAGNSLRHCRVTSTEHNQIDYEVLTKREKVPNFTAFDWYREQESIVATGDGFGVTRVIRLESQEHASSAYTQTYRLRQERKCNSIAINSNGLVAAAYDKARTDASLNVYDINQLSSAEPLRRLANADAVHNVKFFSSEPHLLLAGTAQPKQGASLRFYDLREPSHATPASFVTRHCHLISIDPCDEHYFASCGPAGDPAGPVVSVWDRRLLSNITSSMHSGSGSSNSSVLEIRPPIAKTPQAHIWSLRYSGYKKGCFAVLSSAGQVRCFDTARSPAEDEEQDGATESNTETSDAMHWMRRTHELEEAASSDQASRDRAIAFDFVGPGFFTPRPSILSMRSNKTLKYISLPVDSPVLSYVPRHEVAQERCLQGYLLDCEKNKQLLRDGGADTSLIEMWDIVKRLHRMAQKAGMVHEALDLSYLGVQSIWKEILGPHPTRVSRLFSRTSKSSTSEEFGKAVHFIVSFHSYGKFKGVETSFSEHRQLSLAICGWRFSEQRLRAKCNEMIAAGEHYRAVFYAYAHDRRDIAIEMLRAGAGVEVSQIAGIAVLLAGQQLTSEQKELCTWLAEESSDPYLVALLTHFVRGNWDDIVEMETLPLAFRMAIAIRYASDTELNALIERTTEEAIKTGQPEGLVLTGLTESSMNLFTSYIARTNDLQTALFATSFTNPRYIDDIRWQSWRTASSATLQRWRAFPQRVRFDTAHARLSRTREGKSIIKPPEDQMTLRCNGCQRNPARYPPNGRRSKSRDRGSTMEKMTGSASTLGSTVGLDQRSPAAAAGTVCFNCGRSLPRCSLCMMHLGAPAPLAPSYDMRQPLAAVTPNARSHEAEKEETSSGVAETTNGTDDPPSQDAAAIEAKRKAQDRLVWFCVKCGHGCHAGEARQWFSKRTGCPAGGCGCRCAIVDD